MKHFQARQLGRGPRISVLRNAGFQLQDDSASDGNSVQNKGNPI